LLNNSKKGVTLSVKVALRLALSWCNLSIIQPLKIIQLKATINGNNAIYFMYINGTNIKIINDIIPVK
jgi:hypothetical protein